MTKRVEIDQISKVEKRILLIRREKVIIDADLAKFYGVTTKRLREQIRRNKNRFPEDFMFKLTRSEMREVVDACSHLSNLRYSRTNPFAFTEHGAIMAATVLKSEQAVEMSIFIVRAFINLREVISAHKNLFRKINALEKKISEHDEHIMSLFKAIKQLIGPEKVPQKRRIGFRQTDNK